jgi:hypothetical protein
MVKRKKSFVPNLTDVDSVGVTMVDCSFERCRMWEND